MFKKKKGDTAVTDGDLYSEAKWARLHSFFSPATLYSTVHNRRETQLTILQNKAHKAQNKLCNITMCVHLLEHYMDIMGWHDRWRALSGQWQPSKRLTFIFGPHYFSFSVTFLEMPPSYCRGKPSSIAVLVCVKRFRQLSSQFARVWELHRSSQLKNTSNEDRPPTEAFSLNQADLTWNCSDATRLRGWLQRRLDLILDDQRCSGFVRQIFGFRAAGCERFLISCLSETGGWFI